MKDNLSTRMKDNYEKRTQTHLMRRAYTVLRLDGKAWHTYTRGLERPFDKALMDDVDATALYLCENIQGAKVAYTQSDEISILLTDFETVDTQAWFDYNVQKMTSISASMAAAKFNQLRFKREMRKVDDINKELEVSYMSAESALNLPLANFDARVFQLPDRIETVNYFRWRVQDSVRNSIQSVAQSLYSHKELFGQSTNQLQEMIFQKGINWNDYTYGEKRGRGIFKETYMVEATNWDDDAFRGSVYPEVERSRWVVADFQEEWIP